MDASGTHCGRAARLLSGLIVGVIPLVAGASHRTANFVVEAPSPQAAEQIAARGGFVVGVGRTQSPETSSDRVMVQGDLTEHRTVLCVDPGPMATAMGRPGAERDPAVAAAEILDALGDLRNIATGSSVALMDQEIRRGRP